MRCMRKSGPTATRDEAGTRAQSIEATPMQKTMILRFERTLSAITPHKGVAQMETAKLIPLIMPTCEGEKPFFCRNIVR